MTPEGEFRPIAEEFDTRVNGIRAAQGGQEPRLEIRDSKERTGARQEKCLFFRRSAFPVLIEILRQRDASVLDGPSRGAYPL